MLLIWILEKGLKKREGIILNSERQERLLKSGEFCAEPEKMERRQAGVEKYSRQGRNKQKPGGRGGQGIL